MKKVLIVEDELLVAGFLEDLIGIVGCQTKVLTSGRRVMETVKSWKPDLITLDLMIPPPDGIELLRKLKEDQETREIPVFIVSALTGRDEVAGDISIADASFSKPLAPKNFIEKIQAALGQEPQLR